VPVTDPQETKISTDEVLDIISSNTAAMDTSEKTSTVNKYIEQKTKEYASRYPGGALSDPSLIGNYNVSYVGKGATRSDADGNPAGGRFRGGLGQFIYRNDGLYQNLYKRSDLHTSSSTGSIATDAMKEEAVGVVNMIAGRLFGVLPLTVILNGYVRAVNQTARAALTEKYGTPLTGGTVKAFFEPPLLCLGSSTNSMSVVVQAGRTSSVVLDTPYVDSQLRVGVGSRGSSFIFKRTDASLAGEWVSWLRRDKLPSRPLGLTILVASFGAMYAAVTRAAAFRVNLSGLTGLTGAMAAKAALVAALGMVGLVTQGVAGLVGAALGAFLTTGNGGLIEDDMSS
jgi:hypothetical protein